MESLTFQSKGESGLPNYFGDAPAPIEINGKRKPRAKSATKKPTFSSGPKFQKKPQQKKVEPVVKKASVGWNNNNVPDSKFFYQAIDKKKSSGLGGGGGI